MKLSWYFKTWTFDDETGDLPQGVYINYEDSKMLGFLCMTIGAIIGCGITAVVFTLV